MPYITVGAERIFYSYHTGVDPKAPTMILLHGAGGNHQFWGSAIRRIEGANTYALDLPGHGRSSGTGRRAIAGYASFVVSFMGVLGLEQAVIAGHSMGGATAMQMALENPQGVIGLVLVGTGARLRVFPAILEGTLSNYEDTIELIAEYAYSPHTSAQLVRQGQRQMLKVAPRTVHDDFSACNAFDIMERLGEIHCRSLVICGTEDALTPPKYSTFLAQHIPDSELKWIEGAGHMVMIEEPERVAEAVESALARWEL
jgi:pimeloyl-ACP methyl ester carboxylesterase